MLQDIRETVFVWILERSDGLPVKQVQDDAWPKGTDYVRAKACVT
jgi:hypothetical protein